MKRIVITLIAAALAMPILAQPYVVTQQHKDRAAEIVKKMTLEEKIAYVGGYERWYIREIPHLGLPAVRMADGPQGVRNNTKSTLYPSGIAAAATWDTDLIEKMGISLGKDSRARGVHILLGPGANIYRSPLCGRNFEYFGEDPFLAGEIAASYIKGVQSQGVMACIKHFAGNNQEYARHSVSSDIDERTLHEIYLPAFEKAVKKANVASIMTSYNLVNCVRASESKYLNQEVLREQWGHDGFVMSDWNSCYSPLNLARWGVDIEMPTPKAMEPKLMKQLVEQGVIPEEAFDKKCQNIIQTILAFEFDKRPQLDKSLPENNPECDAVALELSRAAIVMLKNDNNFLPLKKGKFVVCGPNSTRIVTGGGSGFVTPLISSSVATGMASIDKKVKSSTIITPVKDYLEGIFADKELKTPGAKLEEFNNCNLEGEPKISKIVPKARINNLSEEAHEDIVLTNYSTRHTFYYKPQKDEKYRLDVEGNEGFRLFLNGELKIDRWNPSKGRHGWMDLDFKAGNVYEFIVEHYNDSGGTSLEMLFESPMTEDEQTIKTIREADCVVVCLGHNNITERENADRTFELPIGQVEYLKTITSINPNVVVVLNGGGAVEMASWMNDVKAVLMAWYPGQQGGYAVAEIITGKISPSGKLPVSFESKWADNPTYSNYYENVPRMRNVEINPYSRVEYREGLFVGYRGYEKNNVKPLYPFGFGLSYTTFDYSDIAIEQDGKEFVVSFNVKNVGKVAGAEVAQVYVGDDKCRLVRPAKELKGFDKVFLQPGESQKVSVRLDEEAFRFYDPMLRGWVVEPGTFTVHVGASSADIRLTGKLEVK